jgi:hypothetical protein
LECIIKIYNALGNLIISHWFPAVSSVVLLYGNKKIILFSEYGIIASQSSKYEDYCLTRYDHMQSGKKLQAFGRAYYTLLERQICLQASLGTILFIVHFQIFIHDK